MGGANEATALRERWRARIFAASDNGRGPSNGLITVKLVRDVDEMVDVARPLAEAETAVGQKAG